MTDKFQYSELRKLKEIIKVAITVNIYYSGVNGNAKKLLRK